jgi:myosin protein heavy chain
LHEEKSSKEREIEAGKRLRQELADLKHKLDSQHNINEENSAIFKRKHNESIAELSAHMESLSKSKLKFEKENKSVSHQLEEMRCENENLSRAKAHALCTTRDLEAKQADSTKRIDDLLKQLTEMNELKTKLTKEQTEFYRRNSIVEFELQQLSISYKRSSQELDDARMQLENETLMRNTLEHKIKNILLDMEALSGRLDEETEAKSQAQLQLTKAQEEFKLMRITLDNEAKARIDEIEDAKRRLNARYLEIQEQLTETLLKYTSLDKAKVKLTSQVEALSADLDKTRKRADEATKAEKFFERESEEAKTKLNIANAELESVYQASRNHHAEISKFKHLSEHLTEQVEVFLKEKRKTSEELESATNQLLEANGKLVDLERRSKSIEADRELLQNELEDTRDALQSELNKNLNLQSQMDKLKSDTEKKIFQRDDELDAQKIGARRQVETLQSQLEDAEARHKNELASLKKRFQVEVDETLYKLDSVTKSKVEAENLLKKTQLINKELLDKLTEEQHLSDATREQMNNAEKRASTLRAELEEVKALYDRCEKSKKNLDQDYHDLEEKFTELQSAFNRALNERKKFEADALTAADESLEMKSELKSYDERLRSMNASLLKREDELRIQKEIALELDTSRKLLDQQLRETQQRIDETDEFTKRETRRISHKIESQLNQLESDLDLEKAKEQEYIKEIRRLEKRNKDLLDQIGDEQLKLMTLNDAYEKLQIKMKAYKSQIEGAEELAASNISKCKRLQRELEDAEDRAEHITKNFLRSGSVARNNEANYDSDYGDSEQYSPLVATVSASYSRAHHQKDDQDLLQSKPSYTKSPSLNSWRARFKTVDVDDDDIVIQHKPSRFSSSYNTQN